MCPAFNCWQKSHLSKNNYRETLYPHLLVAPFDKTTPTKTGKQGLNAGLCSCTKYYGMSLKQCNISELCVTTVSKQI